MRCLQRAVSCIVLVLLVLPVPFLWGDGGSAQRDLKENLDLPYAAVDGPGAEEDEDAPEIVVLYGQSFEGDGFVFLGEGTT